MTTVLPRNYWRDDRCAKAFWSQHELPAYRELMADTTAWLNPGPGERWLDLGCGAGRLCAALWQKSGGTLAEVTGLDVAALNERSFAKLRADVLRGGLLLSLEPGQVAFFPFLFLPDIDKDNAVGLNAVADVIDANFTNSFFCLSE